MSSFEFSSAIAVCGDLIVSGDKQHIESLGELDGVPIANPARRSSDFEN